MVLTRISLDAVASFCVKAQNAGVLVRKTKDSVLFELFELSPTNLSVLSTPGRLIRQFPATAIRVSCDIFTNAEFQSMLANTLVKMSQQSVPGTKERVVKAQQEHDEERNSTDPRIVTELLMSFLRGLGEPAEVQGICKNTREEVVWADSLLPWRRSELWLLVRVSLQLTMTRVGGNSEGAYKPFMVFLLARVLGTANRQKAPSDILHTMTAKICRRLVKLSDPRNGKWLKTIDGAISEASTLITKRWEIIQQGCEPPLDLAAVSGLNLENDDRIPLNAMDEFISSISKRSSQEKSRFCPTAGVWPLDRHELPSHSGLANATKAYLPFHLAMIETWVASNLDAWIERHVGDTCTCGSLWNLMREYHGVASSCYTGRPEGMSRMLLMVLELWIAIDKAAVHAFPMLRDYDPEIPVQVYQALLLGFKVDMARLHRAEGYVSKRQSFAQGKSKPSVFVSYGEKESFPVRYFSGSFSHQELMGRINADAARARQHKRKEFNKLKEQYDDLMERHRRGTCQQVKEEQHGLLFWVHSPSCLRCELKNMAENLTIDVHEWPLPTKKLEAQATVFELDVPAIFGLWRDATIYVLNDVLGCEDSAESASTSYHLRDYAGLCAYLAPGRWRIHLLSETKPHIVTHRRQKSIATTSIADVCVNNGLCFQYFDDDRSVFLDEMEPTLSVSECCTFQLPGRSKAMQRFLDRNFTRPDGETPNEVIASQSKCPEHMTLGEYKALALLPFGYRIQWMSVLTQLAMPVVDFNKAETATFLLQMSLQAGPNASREASRCSHARLCDVEFCKRMHEHLRASVLRISENWESHTALWTCTFLAARLLSMAAQHVRVLFLDLLRKCRTISYQWLAKLREKAHQETDDKQRQAFQRIKLELSLVHVDSFNVDDDSLRQILSEPEQASFLVEASVNIYNDANILDHTAQSLQTAMYDRWTHTLHRARPIFLDVLNSHKDAFLNLAIKRCWPDFTPDVWRVAPSTCHWFETTCSEFEVHLNILTGSLLVCGRPLSRLPREYEAHASYQRLFGRSILDVMPSRLTGMQFVSLKDFAGHFVHFGMQSASSGQSVCKEDLLVRLEKDGSSFELVPPRVFSGVLPHCFIDKYTHWYHHGTNTVEFRLVEDPWTRREENWLLSRHGSPWKLTLNEHLSLLSPCSDSAEHIAGILSPLESRLDLHMVLESDIRLLSVELPRLQLGFQLKQGESVIRSRQFLGMQVDASQSIGTLVGFKSKLVLRAIDDAQSRRVVIPQGDIRFQKEQHASSGTHVDASVTYGSAARVQAYSIDNLLCQLKDNGKVEGKLYLAYLHALTSYCRPDPFTCRTGTEQALEILGSAAVRSISCLSKVAMGILGPIAALTPERSFYPRNKRVMQVVKWSSQLSFLAQDSRLYKAVQGVLDNASANEFLYPTETVQPIQLQHAKMDLVEREIIRSAGRCVSGFGAEGFTNKHDKVYESRDGTRQSGRARRVSEMVYRINHCLHSMPHQVSPGLEDHLYDVLKLELANGPGPLEFELEYDSKWLEDPKTFLSSLWCPLHSAFQRNEELLDRFQAMAWLATLSYAEKYDEQLVQALLSLCRFPSVSATSLPTDPFFQLAEGYVLQPEQLRSFICNTTWHFDQCPESRLGPLRGEPAPQTRARRQREHKNNEKRARDSFQASLVRQWPCASPKVPQDTSSATYFDVSKAMGHIAPSWAVWHANLRFSNYLSSFVRSLREIPVGTVSVRPAPEPARIPPTGRQQGFVSVKDAFHDPPPSFGRASTPRLQRFVRTMTLSDVSDKLTATLGFLKSKARVGHEHQYLEEMNDSLSSLQRHFAKQLDEDCSAKRAKALEDHLEQCERRVARVYQSLFEASISSTLDSGDASQEAIHSITVNANCHPRVCPVLFLKQLRRPAFALLSEPWKEAIVSYGVAITLVQQARRLVRLRSNEVDLLLRELENTGRQGWDPHNYSEWLLLECESELMIREVQNQIALQMIMPPDDRNAVMQLNMGEGKSSVIIPIVTAALADGSQLVRVVVAKPQAKQMYQILVSKLAGLLDRPVYQMPFSRAIRMDSCKAHQIRQLTTRCMEEGGVMMVQPEHLLSFQLMGLESQISGQDELASQLLRIQRWFNHFARDLVDESDENFSVKFELVYTVGQQQPIDYSPDRWVVVQEALRLVAKFSTAAKQDFPQSIDLDHRNTGGFPRIRILRPDAQDDIFGKVADAICNTGLSGFPIARQPKKVRDAIRRYITEPDLSPEEIEAVEQGIFWGEATSKPILLLRGLLASGILAFAFGQKRWRVNYGTDDKRERKTRLAVPFRAKDSPMPRSEFSHPDVVIVLTCLSYYYGGIGNEDLFSIFELLVRSDRPDDEYQDWIVTAPSMPNAYRQLKGINLRDRIQCVSDIFPHLRFSKGAIDYFLSKMVFAKESREFPYRLSASGWDLGKAKTNPMTGFSGTNDSRYVLPLDVRQLDLPEQKHTNALVLEHLLRPENSIKVVPRQAGGAAFDSETLLSMMAQMSTKTRVVLDVGAQIIDLSNHEFSEKWLRQHEGDDSTQAVVFFSDADELMVLDRSGNMEELQISPFATQLHQCLVFLDESHTRGTDLKLPADYQAAVTLGANLTKDRLVQGKWIISEFHVHNPLRPPLTHL